VRGADPNARSRFCDSALLVTCQRGNVEMVSSQLDLGVRKPLTTFRTLVGTRRAGRKGVALMLRLPEPIDDGDKHL
jgi:hypothetical protein